MLRVLLVDDEPFILQGIKMLIDWEQEGFEIAGMAANGKEAIAFLEQEEVDLIIADIRMPEMTGLELLETIKREKLSNAYFVILSGYADFEYARRAMQNECTEYLLKPIDREMLLKLLEKVYTMRSQDRELDKKRKEQEKAYFSRNVIALIHGKYDDFNLEYVKQHMKNIEGVRYVEIQKAQSEEMDESIEKDMRNFQRELYQCCIEFLKEDANHCVFDVSANEKIYDIGLIFADGMAQKLGLDERAYLEKFYQYLVNNMKQPLIMLVGKKVSDINSISKSYGNTCMLRSFQGFRAQKSIYFYEDEVQVSCNKIVLCKESLDRLIGTIEQNNYIEIKKAIELFYQEMGNMGMNSETSFESGIMRGSKAHLASFACEYAEYLFQLRKNVSRGVLGMVEKEIRESFASNLTLKGLSEKYYVNSAYLGQLFRKKYGQSFKDYLNNYRIEQASNQLIHTDKKIIQIAEEVGYHDLDYFVNRFIQVKGCTPARFRKQMFEE